MTRSTLFERRWPETPVFQEVAQQWREDQSRLLLGLVWGGYDSLCKKVLQELTLSVDDEAVEETLNFLLAMRIDGCKTGDEPFCVVHQPPEQTKRKRGRGRSPQPDIGFVLHEYPRSVWPIEGKVLHHDADVKAYLAEVRDNLLTGRYATFSREGAMLGYLLDGDPNTFLVNLAGNMTDPLSPHVSFPDRPHKVSEHVRTELPHLNSPMAFACHHLALRIPTA
jgi:hypothetical protein